MKINENNTVVFVDENENLNVVSNIFHAFYVEKDREMTYNWVNFEDNIIYFYNLLSELWVVNKMSEVMTEDIFKEKILKNSEFLNRLNNCNQQIAKMLIIVLTSFENKTLKEFEKNKSKNKQYKLLNQVKSILEKHIDYNFEYNKKVILPFVFL